MIRVGDWCYFSLSFNQIDLDLMHITYEYDNVWVMDVYNSSNILRGITIDKDAFAKHAIKLTEEEAMLAKISR